MQRPSYYIRILNFLLGIFLVVLASTPHASALDGGGAWAHVNAYITKEFTLDSISRAIARSFYQGAITLITQEINHAGRTGGTAIVQNWANFLTEATYRGEDVFRAIAANTQYCGYLQANIKGTFQIGDAFKISLQGQNIRIGNSNPYTLRARCSLPNNFDVNKYQKDFSSNGGWSALSRMLEPQNNPFGANLLAQDELSLQRSLAAAADILEAGPSGFTSKRDVCSGKGAGARCVFLGKVFTPGDFLAKSAGAILDKNLEWLTNSDELSDVLSSVAGVIVNQVSNLSVGVPSSTDTIIGDPDQHDRLEYCTARSPQKEVKEKYTRMFPGYKKEGGGLFSLLQGIVRIAVIGSIPGGNILVAGEAASEAIIQSQIDSPDGPCSAIEDPGNPYPQQRCVQECLEAVGYLPKDVHVAPIPAQIKLVTPYEPTPTPAIEGLNCDIHQAIDVNGPVCKDVHKDCRAYCPGQGGPYEGCGSFTNGSAAYNLAAGHFGMVDGKLFHVNNDPNYRNWEWFKAPDAGDYKAWCEPDYQLDGANPPSTRPAPSFSRCIDGSPGGLDPQPPDPECSANPTTPTTPGGPTTPGQSGTCQREVPNGQIGPYGGDIKSIIEEIANESPNILDKNDVSAGSYKIKNLDGYMEEVANKLRGRGYVLARRDTIDDREMLIKKNASDTYAQQYSLARSGDYTRTAHKGLNCTP